MHVSLLNLVFLLQVLQVAKKKSDEVLESCKVFLHKQEVDEACGHQTLQHQGLQLLP